MIPSLHSPGPLLLGLLDSTKSLSYLQRSYPASHTQRLVRSTLEKLAMRAYRTGQVGRKKLASCDFQPNVPTRFSHLEPILWRFIPGFGLSLGERPVSLESSFQVLFLWHNAKEHRWFGLVLRQVSDTNNEHIGIADLSDFDPPIDRSPESSRKRPRLETCADMINSLPVKDFKIV
jgi:hypothetical protein